MLTDGVVVLRSPVDGDAATVVAGRDAVFHRFLGAGSPHPEPSFVVTVDGAVVGWVDSDPTHSGLAAGETNVGFHLFAAARGRGCATRAVALLLHRLALDGEILAATLQVDPDNSASLAVARRLRFADDGVVDGELHFRRPVPPLAYSDGTVTLRRPASDDLDADLGAKDDEQIDRLWLPGQREHWEAMTPGEQRAHAAQGLAARIADFGNGPKWTFSVDADGARAVAYVDCDLANDLVPAGEANVSYAAHPAHRGQGRTSAGVRLVLRFLRDHTAARRAHLIVDIANAPSLRVAQAVGATGVERWDDGGRTLIRHVVEL